MEQRSGLVLCLYVAFVVCGAPVWWSLVRVERATVPNTEISALDHDLRTLADGGGLLPSIAIVPVGLHDDVEVEALRQACSAHARCRSVQPSVPAPPQPKPVQDLALEVGHLGGVLVGLVVLHGEAAPAVPHGVCTLGAGNFGVVVVDTSNPATIAAQAGSCLDRLWARLEAIANPIDTTFSFPPQSKYRLSFTLVVSNPSLSPRQWPIKDALESEIGRFVAALAPLATVETHSQVLYFKGLHPSLKLRRVTSGSRVFRAVSAADVPSFVNSDEWGITSDPHTLNCVLYLPDPALDPIQIIHENGELAEHNSFVLPRWGGVVIRNLGAHDNQTLSLETTKAALRIHLAQIRQSLGLPQHPVAGGNALDEVVHPSADGVSEWELTALKLRHLSQLLQRTSTQLGSVARLAADLTDMAVTADVVQHMSASLSHAQTALQQLKAGNTLGLMVAARMADEHATACMFHATMVPQLYMILTHKAAIYCPFFLPFFHKLFQLVVAHVKRRRASQLKKET